MKDQRWASLFSKHCKLRVGKPGVRELTGLRLTCNPLESDGNPGFPRAGAGVAGDRAQVCVLFENRSASLFPFSIL